MRKIITAIARMKNPEFQLDNGVSNSVILSFVLTKAIALVRGLCLLFYFRIPRLLFLGRNIKFFNIRNIHFGKMVQVGDYVYMSGLGNHGLYIGDHAWIGSHSVIKVSFSLNNLGDHIVIGNNVGIGEFAHLGGAGGLTIGDDCIIGPYFSCHPENHHFSDAEKLIRLQGVSRKGINIGKNCWIGAKVTVLDGVMIGDNCVIAAGTVVNQNIPSNCVAGGVPAKVIRSRTKEEIAIKKVA